MISPAHLHVRPMWALSTCRRASEIELPPIGGTLWGSYTARNAYHPRGPERHDLLQPVGPRPAHVVLGKVVPEPVNYTPMGSQFDFAWLPARTPHGGCIVRVVIQAKSRKIPTRKILPLFFVGDVRADRRERAPERVPGDPPPVLPVELRVLVLELADRAPEVETETLVRVQETLVHLGTGAEPGQVVY